jgi:hypothetical protein
MEAIMIAGLAVVAVSGWYSALDFLSDTGIRIRKRSGVGVKNRRDGRSGRIPAERGVKQMAWVNV